MDPICNVPAYESVRRSSPIDGLNLARVLPPAILTAPSRNGLLIGLLKNYSNPPTS